MTNRSELEIIADLLDAVQKNPHLPKSRQCQKANIHQSDWKRRIARIIEIGFVTNPPEKRQRGKRKIRSTLHITQKGKEWLSQMKPLIAIYRAGETET